jgi:preprotein translocase subunit SecD
MSRSACFLGAVILCGGQAAMWAQDEPPATRKLPDGVYAVQRDGLKEKDVLPLKDGEVLAVHHHRYLKSDTKEPPHFLVVRPRPDVTLELVGAPTVVKDGDEVVRILLKLQPKAAQALEKLTRDHLRREVAIVVGGEVVTMHKIRDVIKSGEVQITSCAAGAAGYLVKQLQARREN